MEERYDPAEDSFILARHVRDHAFGRVLDMGTGSGILAEAALTRSQDVIGADINPDALDYCKGKLPQVTFMESDLFSGLGMQVFDTIIFNPPYLPEERDGINDAALIGGKKGYETIERFLDAAGDHLAEDGIILLLFSSATDKRMVERIIAKNLFVSEELESKRHFFEVLYVYRIMKSEVLRKIGKRGVRRLTLFSKGKRGLIYVGSKGKKKVGVKIQNPESKAIARIANEGAWLKRLNPENIGPKLVYADDSVVIYEFVCGDPLRDAICRATKEEIIKGMKDLLCQMRAMDMLKVDKEEMHHPWKHVIWSEQGPVLLDFERCNISLSQKNVTQFCQFLTSGSMERMLREKGICIDKEKMNRLAHSYKKDHGVQSFQEVLDAF